ncbi:hypothetical protein F4777DRAFT_594847 [Nemania sp. FL0916]|nr:hypothetical protein F4777DRAFT_594847 [Nemania sp. FL0916]
MSEEQDRAPPVGLHVLYQPEKDDALIDIIFVHGFGGHAIKSWQYDGRSTSRTGERTSTLPRKKSVELLRMTATSPNIKRRSTVGSRSEPSAEPVFWPRDLLPIVCPGARIITWGYRTLRSGNAPLDSRFDLFSHVNDLVRGLVDFRNGTGTQERPLVFIAHSLGGIIVKEALRQTEMSTIGNERNIMASTAATIFFGCPHRATKHESLETTVVSMATASSRMNLEGLALSALCGIHNPRWARAQEMFVPYWQHFNFVVKTYQETQGRTWELVKHHADSSKLGDVRENAESLLSDHRTMCQFKSARDAGFRSLTKILQAILRVEKTKRRQFSAVEDICLKRLMNNQPRELRPSVTGAYFGTYAEICKTEKFCSGKTTQLQLIRKQIESQWLRGTASVIYCTAEGSSLGQSLAPDVRLGVMRPVTTIRSLLSQLFAQDPCLRRGLSGLCGSVIGDADLTRFFLDDYIMKKPLPLPMALVRRTFILVDTGDTCDDVYIRELLYCLYHLARNSEYRICVASRSISDHVPAGIFQLELADHNAKDISSSILSHLKTDGSNRSAVVRKIREKAGGCFLWAQFAATLLNEAENDRTQRGRAIQRLEQLPADLYELYELVLINLPWRARANCMTIMRWVMLATEPMTLNDLMKAVRLSRMDSLVYCDVETALNVGLPRSVHELQKTGTEYDSPTNFSQWLRSQTGGLLQLRQADGESEGRQSLGLQYVCPAHDSIRSFFLSGRGFAVLKSGQAITTILNHEAVEVCHYGLLWTILVYLNTLDLSPLVGGYHLPGQKQNALSLETSVWRRNVADQRKLIISSYPFLGYAINNLLYHLLSPRSVRYFIPQQTLYNMFVSNDCRIWRCWTMLLGETDPQAILASSPLAETLLQPEIGASFRLTRVFQAVNKMATGESWFSPWRTVGRSIFPGSPASREREEDGRGKSRHNLLSLRPPLSPSLTPEIRRGPRSRGTVILTRRR